jgi:hypothetical protein
MISNMNNRSRRRHDVDPADPDGDGKFDAADSAIPEKEEGKGKPTPENRNNGCCFSLTVIVFLVITAVFGAGFYPA